MQLLLPFSLPRRPRVTGWAAPHFPRPGTPRRPPRTEGAPGVPGRPSGRPRAGPGDARPAGQANTSDHGQAILQHPLDSVALGPALTPAALERQDCPSTPRVRGPGRLGPRQSEGLC